jgi:hypothetical protein
VAYRHGLRAAELCQLRWTQINLRYGRLHVNRVKSGIESVHPLHGPELRALRPLQGKSPSGHGDERRLTQVLLNLVGNSIKFTDTEEVAIRASASNGHYSVAVRDTGPGISEADQVKLFQEFQQADNSITRKKSGTTLGLAISKRIVECTGEKSHCNFNLAKARPFRSHFPFGLSGKWRKHDVEQSCIVRDLAQGEGDWEPLKPNYNFRGCLHPLFLARRTPITTVTFPVTTSAHSLQRLSAIFRQL